MDKELLQSAAFDSFWNWLLGGVMMIIGVITFFLPNLQPFLNFPTLSEILPPLGWIAIGFIIWLLGFVWNIRRLRKQKNSEQATAQNTTPQNFNHTSGVVVGRDNYGTINQQHGKPDNLPNIEIGKARIRPSSLNISYFNSSGRMIRKIPYDAIIVDVGFSNNPKNRTNESTSRMVQAKIIYYESNKSEIGSITGGWEDLDNSDIVKTVELSFNSETKVLFLAMRFLDETSLYMYGIETDAEYIGRRDRDSTYKLSDGEKKDIQIKIQLIGENWEEDYNLILHYAGKDGESRIDILK